MTAIDRIGTLDVAHDLIELGREAEAIALLDDVLPDRHSIPCAACGVYEGAKCHDNALVTCRFCGGTAKRVSYRIGSGKTDPTTSSVVRCDECYGTGKREQLVDRLIPHASRVLGIARRW